MPYAMVGPILLGGGCGYLILGVWQERRGEAVTGLGFVLVGLRYLLQLGPYAATLAFLGWGIVIGGYLLKIKDDGRRGGATGG